MLVTASTILDTPANVRRFVADNLASGVDHMVVFLDDPAAPGQDQVADALAGIPTSRASARARDWWAGDRPQGLNVRQRINANWARELLAPFDWAEWLFHVDGDEVVALDREALAAVPAGTDAVWLTPLEASASSTPPSGRRSSSGCSTTPTSTCCTSWARSPHRPTRRTSTAT